jgi:hypothetical protein
MNTKDIKNPIAERDFRFQYKLEQANEIVKEEVRYRSHKGTWQYIDFVEEDRFLIEIRSDGFDVENHTAQEIADYAIDQVY